MSFSSKLELRMTWFEKRIRWRNLRASQNLNRVPQFIPQVLLGFAHFHRIVLLAHFPRLVLLTHFPRLVFQVYFHLHISLDYWFLSICHLPEPEQGAEINSAGLTILCTFLRVWIFQSLLPWFYIDCRRYAKNSITTYLPVTLININIFHNSDLMNSQSFLVWLAQMDFQAIARLEDCTTLITTDCRWRKRRAGTSGSQPSSSPTLLSATKPLLINRWQFPILIAQKTILDFKAVLTVVKQTGAIPAPPEEAMEVLGK